MSMMVIGGLLLGFALLIVGGEVLVKGAVGAAEKLGVSPLVIGLTLVGFGTSMPEMVVSIDAVWKGLPGLAMGNIVGSNISNILLIVGLTALVLPIPVSRATIARDGSALMIGTLLFMAAAMTSPFTPTIGAVFVFALVTYLVVVFLQDRRQVSAQSARDETPREKSSAGAIAFNILIALVGMAIVIAGGHLLVDNASAVARAWNVPVAVIGVTIVAVGTSLPELATALIAAFRGQSDVAIGSVFGSNLFNLLSIGGVTALVAPAPYAMPVELANFDNYVMLAATVGLLGLAWTGRRVSRLEGGLLFAAYLAYLATVAAMNLG